MTLQFPLPRAKYENWLLFAVLGFTAIFSTADIVSDLQEGEPFSHVMLEVMVAVAALGGALLLWSKILALRSEVREQRSLAELAEVAKLRAITEAAKWRDEAGSALKGLSDAIDSQLERWKLSAAEKQVALLLLKGLSLKEIAEVRGVGEKTARAQSFAVYSKSGLSGRAELSAFFLADLMLPAQS